MSLNFDSAPDSYELGTKGNVVREAVEQSMSIRGKADLILRQRADSLSVV